MSTLVKIVAGLFAALVLAVGSLVAYWVMGDRNEWRDYLARLAGEQLGRELVVKGAVEPSFSFTKGLTVKISDMTLANADGFQPKEMLSVPELEVGVDVRALFSNNIHINGLTLNGATLNLESRGNTNNWTFKKREQTQRTDTAEPAVKTKDGKTLAFAADDITASDLLITSKADGKTQTFKIHDLAIKAPADDRFELEMEAAIDNKKLLADIKTGSLKDFIAGLKQKLDANITYGERHVMLKADYSRHQDQHRLENLTFTVDKLTLAGSAAVNMAQAVPQVNAKLQADSIDTAWYMDKKSAGASSGGKGDKPAGPIFSRNPLPWEGLRTINGDIRFDVKQLLQDGKPWGPGHIRAQLNGGDLASTVIVQPPGAPQPVTITVGANTAQRLNLSATAPALDAVLWARFLGDDPFILSPARVQLNVAGQGASLHDVAASANGALQFAAQPGKLKPDVLPNNVRRVLDAVFTPAKVNAAQLGCMQANFNIQNGVMHSNGIGIDSDIAAASGEGAINLGTETIKMRFVTQPKLSAIADVRIPVTIDGPLQSPGFGADAISTAGQVAGKVAGTVLGARFGDFAGQALNTVTSQLVSVPPNPCVTTASEPAPDQVTTPSTLKNIVPPQIAEDVEKARQKTIDFLSNPFEKLKKKSKAEGTGAVPAPAPLEAQPAAPAPVEPAPAAPAAPAAEQPAPTAAEPVAETPAQ